VQSIYLVVKLFSFSKGFETLDDTYDIIVKLDADLILPNNYFETIVKHFEENPTTGMAGGFAYIEKNGEVLENLTDKDHIRGAFKAYRKACFKQMGGLKAAMGWDTVDELLSTFYGWKVVTDARLIVKHLKPTGANYKKPLVTNKVKLLHPRLWIYHYSNSFAKLSFMKRSPYCFRLYTRFYKS
jgi:hypothetical protein